ncbi:hypothetical protein AV650_21550 [Serratia fonticola]|nr:hypothetical protein AV650_21550 [Serratia fonticola]
MAVCINIKEGDNRCFAYVITHRPLYIESCFKGKRNISIGIFFPTGKFIILKVPTKSLIKKP